MRSIYSIFIIAVSLQLGCCAPDFKPKTRENLIVFRDDCVSSLDLSEDYTNKYKSWDFPDDEKTKCYIKCVFNKMSFFDDDTGFHIDNIMKQIGMDSSNEEIKGKITQCADKGDITDNCEWAYKGFTCFKSAHDALIRASIGKKN